MKMWDNRTAIRWGQWATEKNRRDYSGRCAQFAARIRGFDYCGYPSAKEWGLDLKRRGVEFGKKADDAPVGALHFWTGPNQYGHVCMSIGKGRVITNFTKAPTTVAIVNASYYGLGSEYLGWVTELNRAYSKSGGRNPDALGGVSWTDGSKATGGEAPDEGDGGSGSVSESLASSWNLLGLLASIAPAVEVTEASVGSGSTAPALGSPAFDTATTAVMGLESENGKMGMRDATFNPLVAPSPGRADYSLDGLGPQWSSGQRGWIVRDPLAFGSNYVPSSDLVSPVAGARDEADRIKQAQDASAKDSGLMSGIGNSTFYGFRFLYNPESYTEAYTTDQTMDPGQFMKEVGTGTASLVGASGGVVTVNLLLTRVADRKLLLLEQREKELQGALRVWSDSLTGDEKRGIIERGTLYDLEYLFRVLNGDPKDTWHGISSDWGMITPMLVIVSLGDHRGPNSTPAQYDSFTDSQGNPVGSRRIRGQITNVAITHKMFDAGMIPVVTELSLSIDRLSDGYWKDAPEEVPETAIEKSEVTYNTDLIKSLYEKWKKKLVVKPSDVGGGNDSNSNSNSNSGTYSKNTKAPLNPIGETNSYPRYNGGRGGWHGAEDYTCPIGTDVFAVLDGKVVGTREWSDQTGGEGTPANYVILNSMWKGKKVTIFYAHLKHNGVKVKKGDWVKAGDRIAKSGNTGHSTGPHLHISAVRGWHSNPFPEYNDNQSLHFRPSSIWEKG